MLSLVPLLEGRLRFTISQIEVKTSVENIVSNVYFLCVVPRYHFHSWYTYIFSRLILENGSVNERKRW